MLNNNKIIEIGLNIGLLNYIDNETPRHYFIRGDADLNTVLKFADLIIDENNLIDANDCTNWYQTDEYANWFRDELMLEDKTDP